MTIINIMETITPIITYLKKLNEEVYIFVSIIFFSRFHMKKKMFYNFKL